MLKHQFGFATAEFKSLAEVVKSEVEEADLIVIDGYVPGGIYFPAKVCWRGKIEGLVDIKQFIRSKSERKEIDANRDYFLSRGYTLKTLPLTEELFGKFNDLYEETVLKKERAMHFDLGRRVMSLLKVGAPVFLLGLFDGEGNLQSALIFDVYVSGTYKEARVSYGAKKKFDHIRGGAGGVLEYELLRYCQENQITEIDHGRSKNPAGLLSNSGIFEFKARYGYTAYPESSWKTIFIKNPAVALTDWIFVTIFDDRLGYLIVTKEPKEETKNKYLTKEINNVKVISYEEAQGQAREFIQQNL